MTGSHRLGDMPPIADQVTLLRAEVADACARAHRSPETVRIIAVTKSQGPAVLPELTASGLTVFGENRVEHLLEMSAQAPTGSSFHAIGRIQGRQLKTIVEHCACLHSLCEDDHLAKLSRLCVAANRTMPVFLQVNTSGEAAKAGLAPAAVVAFLAQARALPGIQVDGLMAMAPEMPDGQSDDGRIRACFRDLAQLARQLGVARLSMGMSQDFAIAIEEGATDIRVGTRLFR